MQWEATVEARKKDLMSEETFEDRDHWFTADASRRSWLGWTGNLRFYNADFIKYIGERVTWE